MTLPRTARMVPVSEDGEFVMAVRINKQEYRQSQSGL